MTDPLLPSRIARLTDALSSLRSSQLGWIEAVVSQFGRPAAYWRDPASDLITPCVLDDFGKKKGQPRLKLFLQDSERFSD